MYITATFAARIVAVGIAYRVAMPNAANVVTAVNALLIVDKNQICRVETIITIYLHKEIGRYVQTGFNQADALLENN